VLATIYRRAGSRSLVELVEEPAFRRLSVYEPAMGGTLRDHLSGLPDYLQSRYWPDVPSGEYRDGVLCEDLEQLTFPDETFDLVISSDVFEHVRRPWHAFAELARVLRPGGRHVFTVPIDPRPESLPRIDVTGEHEIRLMPDVRHPSPADPDGSLVYTDFGLDLPERLAPLGFEVTAHQSIGRTFTFVCQRRENSGRPIGPTSGRSAPPVRGRGARSTDRP
jgi:SAM-dependent methyltransferase